MAKKKNRDEGNPMEVNLTPMIDCTFQLIIFFIITAQISNEELAPMLVPEPAKSRAVKPGEGGRPDVVIVNVFSDFKNKPEGRDAEPILAMQAEGYKIKQKQLQIGQEIEIKKILEEEKELFKRKNGDATFYVEVRADRDIGYDQILPVMQAAAQAGIGQMYMTAIVDPQFEGAIQK